MAKKIIKTILFGLLLFSYFFLFANWCSSKLYQVTSNGKKYKNEKGILVAKERLSFVIDGLIEANIVEEEDIEELDGMIIDDYIERYNKHSFHCYSRCKFVFDDYYIELGCNYYPEMNRSFDYQCTLIMKVYRICELEQATFESEDIDFTKIDELFAAISKYLRDKIDSKFVERYYNKQALLDSFSVNYPFADYECQYESIFLSYSIRDCRDEIGSHYDKEILPESIDGYIGFTIEVIMHC